MVTQPGGVWGGHPPPQPNQSHGEGKPSRNGSQQPPGCLSQCFQVLTVDVSGSFLPLYKHFGEELALPEVP